MSAHYLESPDRELMIFPKNGKYSILVWDKYKEEISLPKHDFGIFDTEEECQAALKAYAEEHDLQEEVL